MRLLAIAALLGCAACGPGRDQSFSRILQLSAVDKLAVADRFIYFTEAGALKRVSIKGGNAEIVTSTGVLDFAVVDGHIYAATSGSGVLHYTVFASGDFELSGDISGVSAVAVAADASGVSWLSCVQLAHASLDGSNKIVVQLTAPCSQGGTRLALDSSTAYGIDSRGEWWASRSGGAPTPFATEHCTRLAASGGWLYCGSGAGLVRMRPFGTTTEPVLSGNVRSFAISEARVYASLDDSLVSSPRNTKNVEVLGTYAAISALAIDSTSVYFVNTDGDLGLMLRTAL